MKTLLFTTAGCHLCEQALKQLETLQDKGLAIDIESVDIANSDTLLAQYGTRIPVIRAAHRDHDLEWPFELAELQAFLQ